IMLLPKSLFLALLCSATVTIVSSISPCSVGIPPTSCSACIKLHSSCAWCTDESFDDSRIGPQHRCGTKAELRDRGCILMESPVSRAEIMLDNPLSDSNQIKPQNVSVWARTHHSIQLEFEFKQAENYPVDMYILSDKSHSMRDFLQSVANMSEKIQQTLGELTRNWRIGVGFFVDKPVFPYVQPNPSAAPCDSLGFGERCIDTFSYIHAMDLSQNVAELKEVTAAKTISANLDAPEGSLDALLQAVICRSQIGWRSNSRKVVLLAIDGGFHMAGDGRFGGIIEPFPESQCHLETGRNKLNVTGSLEYVNATRFDYPSIGQVAKVLSDAKVSVIFALKSDSYTPLYMQLKHALPVVTEVDLVTNDNVLELIKKNYRSIAETVEIRANDPGLWLNITSEVRCPGETDFKLGNRCHRVPLGATVSYRATVTLTKCLPRPEEIVHFASTTSDDRMEVRIKSLCNCPECEAKANPLQKVPKCQNVGHLECGVCSCHGNYSGDSCQCDAQTGSQVDQCHSGDVSNICSKNGRCVCNKCVCYKDNYYGKLCELDKLSCPDSWDTKEPCGGPSRGECDGKRTCICKPGYSEKDCSCSDANKLKPDCHSKKEQYKDMQCSNHGTCICGRCVCEALWSSDPHCDTKAGSTGSLCNDEGLRRCVECVFNHRKLAPEDRQTQCNCSLVEEGVWIDASKIQLTPQSEVINDKSTCVLNMANECSLLYGYIIGDGSIGSRSIRNMTLFIQEEKQCRDRVSPLILVLIVVAAVVIVGIIILLIWKALITISDRREFAKFKSQTQNSAWGAGENPVYRDPNTTVTNPVFAGKNDF
ncbi:hypothetical protein BOX15_Mlig008227g1, partial [Macrostomum lignano]